MHTFQPYPIDMLDINPFTKLSKEWALVTAGDKEKSNTMTVSWGGTGVLWGKNVVFIFIRESRYTKDFIDNGEFFSLSFLSEKYRDALKYCGAHSGRGEDKWSKAGLTPATRHGIPYPDDFRKRVQRVFASVEGRRKRSQDSFGKRKANES